LIDPAAIVYESPSGDWDEALQMLRRRCPNAKIIVKTCARIAPGFLSLGELIGTGAASSDFQKQQSDCPAVIFFSSGTTGKPKAAIGLHDNLQKRWLRLSMKLGFSPEDVHLAHLPLAHGFGLMMAMSALLTGGRLVLMDGFSRDVVFRILEEEGITVLNGSSAHFQLVASRLECGQSAPGSLRVGVGSAAAFPLPLLRTILNEWGIQFMFMYGSSEGVGVVTTDRNDILLGSVGRPAPGSVAIQDTEGCPLPVGQAGEIVFSRRVFPVRYWGAHVDGAGVENSASIGDWFHSGDRGRLDEEGRLYVLGRMQLQINRGGLKIDPAEVEQAIQELPGIADAIVIGVHDSIVGERVFAFVVPADESALTLEYLRIALSKSLAHFKLPEGLQILDRIPLTSVGKPDLESLRKGAPDLVRNDIAQN
jgi:acyl-CoA synthetase (AMP-forming)/AMP-acid ligase II